MRARSWAWITFPLCGCIGGVVPPGPSQGPSLPCNLDLGVDACGAGLVCAALDGRETATCYQERSRPDLSECSDDLLCESGSCDGDAERCQSAYLASCDGDVGCASTDGVPDITCRDDADGDARCLRGPLAAGESCRRNDECSSNDCRCIANDPDGFSCCSS